MADHNPYFDNIVNSYPDQAQGYSVSRYHRLNRIKDDTGDEYVESYEPIEFPENSDDQYHLVTPGEENRLDLISYKFYGTALLYWVIAEASGIEDPFNVPAGSTVRVPSRQSLYGLKGVLR